jgi:hypothetical protein
MLLTNPIKYCMHLQQMHSFQKKRGKYILKKKKKKKEECIECTWVLGYLFLLQDSMILLHWVLEQELEPEKLKSLQIGKAQFFGF